MRSKSWLGIKGKCLFLLQKAFPTLYHRLFFLFLDQGARGNLEKVWSQKNILVAQRNYEKVIVPVLNSHVGKKVGTLLDLGCEIGNYMKFLKDYADKVVGIDFMKKRIEKARKLWNYKNVEF